MSVIKLESSFMVNQPLWCVQWRRKDRKCFLSSKHPYWCSLGHFFPHCWGPRSDMGWWHRSHWWPQLFGAASDPRFYKRHLEEPNTRLQKTDLSRWGDVTHKQTETILPPLEISLTCAIRELLTLHQSNEQSDNSRTNTHLSWMRWRWTTFRQQQNKHKKQRENKYIIYMQWKKITLPKGKSVLISE